MKPLWTTPHLAPSLSLGTDLTQCSILSEPPVLAATARDWGAAPLLPEVYFADTPRNLEPGHLPSFPAHILSLLEYIGRPATYSFCGLGFHQEFSFLFPILFSDNLWDKQRKDDPFALKVKTLKQRDRCPHHPFTDVNTEIEAGQGVSPHSWFQLYLSRLRPDLRQTASLKSQLVHL